MLRIPHFTPYTETRLSVTILENRYGIGDLEDVQVADNGGRNPPLPHSP